MALVEVHRPAVKFARPGRASDRGLHEPARCLRLPTLRRRYSFGEPLEPLPERADVVIVGARAIIGRNTAP